MTHLSFDFHLRHHALSAEWGSAPGIYTWVAELVVRDSAAADGPRVVVGTAYFVCVDTVECDDFVVDLDWSPELGEMAMKKRERTP